MKPWQTLEQVRYFTTRVRDNPSAELRQSIYLDALSDDPLISIEYGHFLTKQVKCRQCGSSWRKAEEKKTDVNLAVRLLEDGFDDRYDVAMLMSGDSDLVPPLLAVRARSPEKRLLVAFPPKRHSAELRATADAAFTIPANKVRNARLPAMVTVSSGVVLHAPKGWLPPA